MADISQVNFPNDNNNPYDIADTTARSGLADKMDKVNPTGTGSFSLNRKADTTVGTNSFAEGYNTTASGQYSHAEGASTRASGQSAHAEGVNSVASGTYCPHAEGYQTTASGSYSHAEGINTTASGNNSHSEGEHTTASGIASHTENRYTTASGHYSHAEGYYTTANHESQHVMGEYNVLDDSTAAANARGNYVEIVGNGTADNSRSNARTLDWSGNEVLSGTIEATGFGTTLDREVDRGGVQLTQAQYDALVSAGTVDANTTYFITDGQNITTASAVSYDNTASGMTATNVQAAIDEVNAKDADDIPYSQGVSVADKLDIVNTCKTIYNQTTYQNDIGTARSIGDYDFRDYRVLRINLYVNAISSPNRITVVIVNGNARIVDSYYPCVLRGNNGQGINGNIRIESTNNNITILRSSFGNTICIGDIIGVR